MKRSALTIVAVLTAVHLSHAAVLCVAPDGSPDGDGTSINPFNSLPAAISAAYCRTDYCLVAIEPGSYTNAAPLWLGNERVMLRGSGMAQTRIVGDVVITADLHAAALTFCGVVSNTGALLCQDVKLDEPPVGDGQVLGLWREGASDIQHLTWLAGTTNALDAVNYETLVAHTYSSFTNFAVAFALADTNWVSYYVDATALTITQGIIDARGASLENVMDIVLSLPPVSSATVYSVFEYDSRLFDTSLAQAPPVGTTPRFLKFVSGAQAGQCRSIYSCGQGSWSGGQFYYYQLEVGISGANPGDIFEIYESDPRLGRTLADLYVRKAGDTLAGDLWYNLPLSNAGSIGVEGTNSSRVALYGYWTHGRVATEYYLPTCAAPYYLGIWDNQSEVGLYQNSSLAPLRVGQPTADSHAATKGYVDSRTIPSTNIADAAVTASKLADGAVSVSKLGEDVDSRYVNAAGDEMTGDLYMNGRAIHYPEVYQGSIYSPSVYSPYLYQPALDYGQLLSDLDANGSTVHGLGAPSQQSDAATKGYVDDSFKGFDYDARYVYIDKYYDGSNGYHGTLQAPYTNFLHALSVMGSNSFYGGMWAPDKPVIYHVANGFYHFPSLQLTGTNHYVRVGIVGRGAFYRNIHEHLNAYGSSVFTEFGTYIDEIVACRIDGPTNWAHAIIYLKDLVVSNVLLISSGYDEVYCDNVVFLSPTNGGEQIYHGLYYVGAMGSPVGNYEALIASSIRPGYFDEVVATNNAMYVSKAGDTMSGALSIAAQLTASNINVSVPDWHVGSEETVGNIIIENTDGKVSARRGHLNLASDSGNIVAQSPLTFSAGAGVRGTGASPGQPISCAACSVSAQVIVTPTTQPLGQWYVVKSNGWFRVDPSWSGFTFDWLVIPASP